MRNPWTEFVIPNQELFEPLSIENYAGTNHPQQTVYWSIPKGKKDLPLVIFFHGGGMINGGRECPYGLFNGEYAIAEPRYRFSPQHPAPAQIEDAVSAIAYCVKNALRHNVNPNKIFVGGMSAGAYLAAISVMNTDFLKKYGLHYRDFAGLILISGQMTTHFNIKSDLGRDNGRYNPLFDEYAPLSHLAADLPPIIMVTGESGLDMPARPEENAFMAASLKAMGHNDISCYHLQGHCHGTAFDSCDSLVLEFLSRHR